MPGFYAPDHGYDEHQARAALDGLIDSTVSGIRIFTLDELQTSADGRDVHADLAIELWLDQRGDETVALFHWGSTIAWSSCASGDSR